MKLEIADVRREWEHIKDAVAELCADGQARAEDVYADCKHGKASLLICADGFLVVRIETCNYTGQTMMFVWLAHANIVGAVEKYQPELDRIAREQGATVIRMNSTRKGWERAEGWHLVTSVYERRL